MKRNNSGLTQVVVKNYCDHFQSIQPSKIPPIKKLICNICKTLPPNIWICLAKGCGTVVCSKNKFKHLWEHNEESNYKHHIFLNYTTTEIKCISCNIEILDFDQLQPQEYENIKDKLDPLILRRRFIKKQKDNVLFKNGGNIENSEAHKKNSQGLCGLLSKNGETSITCVIQFFSNIKFLRDVLKNLRVTLTDDNSILLSQIVQLIIKIWSGQVRIISIYQFQKTVINCLPSFKGYSRKNPLQFFTLIFNIIHEAVKFKYHISQTMKQPQNVPDQWQMIQSQNFQHSVLKNNLCNNIVYKLKCNQCKSTKEIQGQVYKLELEIPKIRKQSKVLQSQFERHKFESPLKGRRKSLVERIFHKDIQIPISLAELIINYIKNRFPSNKQLKICEKCKKQMVLVDTKFSKLSNLLLIIIHNPQKDPSEIIKKPNVQFPTDILDMKGFVEDNYEFQTQYQFQSAICQKQYQYVTLAKGKHLYEFMNENVKLTNQTMTPYILCYSIKNRYQTLYRNVKSNIKIQIAPEYKLPDFWIQQLKHFQPYPLINPQVCKHSKIKNIQAKITKFSYVPKEIYTALVQKFGGRIYTNQICFNCSCQFHSINVRRKKQKQYISKLDGYKCKIYCMISCKWLNKWTQYLYKKCDDNYSLKGNPMPGIINNSVLFDGGKLKQTLTKGEDFKLLNFYVWSFFKQLYGGGPQVQYKTKVQDKQRFQQLYDNQVIKQIKQKVKQLKQYMKQQYYIAKQWPETPSKKKSKQQTIKTFNTNTKIQQ